ncbi:MAG: hypothetical protein M3364_09910 [Actinomycetota bacterium]|nr:hypothetical protein [Actinomycetota bacterium]
MSDADRLFDEFATSWARGERPDVADYLEQVAADAERADLASLVDAFLATAPVPEPTEEEVAIMRARLAGDPGLVALRVERGLKRGTVVDRLVELLGLPGGTRGKVGRRYHELESGLLDSRRVSPRVWEALAGIFGRAVHPLAALRPPEAASGAYYRTMDARMEMAPPSPGAAIERDEVDELFLGP